MATYIVYDAIGDYVCDFNDSERASDMADAIGGRFDIDEIEDIIN